MKNFVDINYLEKNIDNVVLVDARNNFMVPGEGRALYNKSHIKNSFHIGLSEDMVGTIKEHGGRDPLPDDISSFSQKLESFGISNDTEVIVYDSAYMYAGRFWWMCKYIGLTNVKLLNASEDEIKKSNLVFTDEVTILPKEKGKINISLNNSMIADIDDIRKVIEDENSLIIDSRDKQRFLGAVEVVDAEAGHIPNALNYPFMDIIKDGKIADTDFLEKHFEKLREYDNIYTYCGSGVSATVNIIALSEIGIDVKLYVGSWSDYITYKDSVIIKEVL